MSAPRQPRLPADIVAELDATGLPWGMVHGKKHWKVTIDGRQAFVLSHGRGPGDGRKWRNTVRDIRRAARGVEV